jgi:hypothetical protein
MERSMNISTKSRVLSFLGAIALVSVVACADSPTQPTVPGARAARDTIPPIEGDTLDCRSGWTVINGRYVCLNGG